MNIKLRMHVLVLVVVLGLGILPANAQEQVGITIADIVASFAQDVTPEFTIFAQALQIADQHVLNQLNDPNESLTLFLPTDAAFRKIRESRYGASTLRLLFQQPDMLTNLLEYHMVANTLSVPMLRDRVENAPGVGGASLQTIQGQYLRVMMDEDDRLLIDTEAQTVLNAVALALVGDDAALTVAGTELSAINGVIHVIDTVLVPTTDTIQQLLDNPHNDLEGNFTILRAVLDTADPVIKQYLAEPYAEVTLLAPTDAAFEALGPEVRTAMTSEPEVATQMLNYHLLTGRISSVGITLSIINTPDSAAIYFTEFGNLSRSSQVEFTIDSTTGGIVVNGRANLIVRDVDAGNGMIHVIDAILDPPLS